MTIAPTVHTNGTSKNDLLEQICNATDALDAAYSALNRTAPNGRDYYPQGVGALEEATREHFSRLKRIDSVRMELEALANAIDVQ